jgi:hypothetical protein
MLAYASRTGTKRNLAALRAAGWRLMLSPAGRMEPLAGHSAGFAYALDNGAWTAFTQKQAWDESAFLSALDRFGPGADWVVAPDIVCGGKDSLKLSISWLARCLDKSKLVLIPVQDGMTPHDVAGVLCRYQGIFVGGSEEWKEKTIHEWAQLARERNAYCHVGRVNSQRRLRLCQMAGVDSFDGSGPSRFEKQLAVMERGLAQPCFRVAEVNA